MANSEPFHNHYWPGENLVPITPQAQRFGYVFPVYVTRSVWSLSISWKQGKSTNPDKRITELLDSSWKGMGKALSSEPDRVMFPFKHWYWDRDRPKAKKQRKTEFAARLFLYPDTEEPWMLIFLPTVDGAEVLDYGEPGADREDEGETRELGRADGTTLDQGVHDEGHASERSTEGSVDELDPSD